MFGCMIACHKIWQPHSDHKYWKLDTLFGFIWDIFMCSRILKDYTGSVVRYPVLEIMTHFIWTCMSVHILNNASHNERRDTTVH
jgi:hypothetical protein